MLVYTHCQFYLLSLPLNENSLKEHTIDILYSCDESINESLFQLSYVLVGEKYFLQSVPRGRL